MDSHSRISDWKWIAGFIVAILGLMTAVCACIAGYLALIPIVSPPKSATPITVVALATPSRPKDSLPTQTSITNNSATPIRGTPTKMVNEIPTSVSNGRIVFSSQRDGNSEIYVMNADGSGQTNLTQNPANDANPTWSSDGLRIAFDSNRDGSYQIYVMNSDGTGLSKLTSLGLNAAPAWSPDGKKIAFLSVRERDVYPSIYIMNIDGSAQTRLFNNGVDIQTPTWSPDGKRLTFSSDSPTPGTDPYSIFAMNADGSGVNLITYDVHKNDTGPSWSPDGRFLAFSRYIGPGRSDIMLWYLSDNGQSRITGTAANNGCPSWSPDGNWIVFSSDLNNSTMQIYKARPDGSGLTRLTFSSGDDWCPKWK